MGTRVQTGHGAVTPESLQMEVGRAQSIQPYAEPRPSSSQLSGSGPLGDKPKVAWPLQAFLLPRAFSLSYSCFIFCHPKILLKYLSRITVGWRRIQVSTQNVNGSLTSACFLQAQLAFPSLPEIRRAGTGRQVAVPEPRARTRCGRRGKSASGSPRYAAAKRSIRAILELAGRTLATQNSQPSSLPYLPGATRWELSERPPLVRVSPDFSGDPGLPPSATAQRKRRPRGPPHFPSPRDLRGPWAQWPPTQGWKLALPKARAPTHRGASLALPRVPMAAAALREPPHLGRRVGLGWAQRIATAAAACGALRPGPLHPRAAHPPLSEPGEPARRAPAGTNFVCARPLAFIRARTHPSARTT